ncbi:MAG: hypothetical protein GY765_21590 [bacterium]|nr:hypothetical protein [bacterium]
MKVKKLVKKISLNKTTIANLDQNHMGGVQGGANVNLIDDRRTGLKDCHTELVAGCDSSCITIYNCSAQLACIGEAKDIR